MLSGYFSTEKILRDRQRQEICGALRGSNLYYLLFMFKNVVEIILALLFIALNLVVGLESTDATVLCGIELLDSATMVTMQCRQKRYDVFIHLLWVFTITLVFHALVNICSVCWGIPYTGLRQITGIMKELQEAIKSSRAYKKSVKAGKRKDISHDAEMGLRLSLATDSSGEYLAGADFLFLFDLIACTCGKAATLRVLSYTSPSFERLCQPRIIHQDIQKTETSLKISWTPTPLQQINQYDRLTVSEYVATIFPGHAYQTLAEDCKEVEFKNLSGGTTEYTITVSAIIGNAKMKGVAIQQFLKPFPPQNLTVHPSITLSNNRATARVSWTPPRGDFHKYSLRVLPWRSTPKPLRKYRQVTNNVTENVQLPDEIWLPKDATEHLAEGLMPGEKYKVELCSMTDFTKCTADQSTEGVILTNPLQPANMSVKEDTDKIKVKWDPPLGQGHSNLVGYMVYLRTQIGDSPCQELYVPCNSECRAQFTGLLSSREHVLEIASVCPGNLSMQPLQLTQPGVTHLLSECISRTVFTLPKAPTNLRVDACQPTTLSLKWDATLECSLKQTFALLLTPLNSELGGSMRSGEAELPSFAFSRLLEGQPYEVAVEAVVYAAGKNYYSSKTKRTFLTRPLPPENLLVLSSEEQIVGWSRSKTAGIKRYKLKIKAEEERAKDFMVEDNNAGQANDGSELSFKIGFPLKEGVEYKINVYSVATFQGQTAESEPCHVKAFLDYENSEFYEEGRGKCVINLIR